MRNPFAVSHRAARGMNPPLGLLIRRKYLHPYDRSAVIDILDVRISKI